MRVEYKEFKGLVALNELTDGDYIYWNFFEKAGDVPVAGKGMCWLTLIPDGKKRSITAMFTRDGSVSAWYVDVIHSLNVDEDGVLFFKDQYLDVLLTTAGDVLVQDEDELYAAYQAGELSKEEYEEALSEGQAIIDEMTTDICATELICKDLLQYVRAQAKKHPLTIFLDIDGVLDIFKPNTEVQDILPEALKYLADLVHRMKAQVVVISMHRFGGKTWDILLNLFKEYEIGDIDITPYGEEYQSRTEEINAYLQMHSNIERFVILDDCFQDDYTADVKLLKRLVFVDALKGLQKDDVIKASEILNQQIQ